MRLKNIFLAHVSDTSLDILRVKKMSKTQVFSQGDPSRMEEKTYWTLQGMTGITSSQVKGHISQIFRLTEKPGNTISVDKPNQQCRPGAEKVDQKLSVPASAGSRHTEFSGLRQELGVRICISMCVSVLGVLINIGEASMHQFLLILLFYLHFK